MDTSHQQYLLDYYQKKAQELLSGNVTLEQFAKDLASIHLNLEIKAQCDGLITSFYNSHGFNETLVKWLDLTRRLNLPSVLLALDIDQLKRFNDTQGHIAGDNLIKLYAEVINQSTRNCDLKGRLGGDEFAVFLIGCDLESAKSIAERIRVGIIQAVKENFPNLPWDQTISIGIAQTQKEDNAESLRQKADQVLYQAKQQRNQTVIFEEVSAEPKPASPSL